MQLLRLILILLCTTLFAGHSHAQSEVSTNAVDVSSEREVPAEINPDQRESESRLLPFGDNLFRGASFSAEREDGLNPEYIIQPGDRIALRIWGATNVNEVSVVDAQGNIFIPEVGPVQVENIRNGDLNQHIRGEVQQVFTQNINVYTNLQSTTPVLVFVTGFVNRPGSYAGVASDSLLYFLERAGGIDHQRGSFRNIRIQGEGEEVTRTDLYEFLIAGVLPRPQFADGDTIVVGTKGDTINVEGAVRNSYTFELIGDRISGREVINLARPWANATYTTVTGTRDSEPFSRYMPMSEFTTNDLLDGDQILFEVDQVRETILIRVEGSHIGQSRFAVPRDTRLNELLDYIKVDPQLADIKSISLRRESIKNRQKQAINESLTRLETAVLSGKPITPEGAQVKIAEAELITQFVQRAREVEPAGILVVSEDGILSDVLLQPNDIITIPEKTDVIQISGEVMVPQAVVYEPGNNLKDYVERAGGYTGYADEKRHMILRRNGEVIPIFGRGNNIDIQQGDEIISLPEIHSTNVDIIRMVTDIVFKVAGAAAVFISI